MTCFKIGEHVIIYCSDYTYRRATIIAEKPGSEDEFFCETKDNQIQVISIKRITKLPPKPRTRKKIKK